MSTALFRLVLQFMVLCISLLDRMADAFTRLEYRSLGGRTDRTS